MHMPVQIVESAAPQWEVEHNLWLRAENLRDGFAKEYPKPVRTLQVAVCCTRRMKAATTYHVLHACVNLLVCSRPRRMGKAGGR